MFWKISWEIQKMTKILHEIHVFFLARKITTEYLDFLQITIDYFKNFPTPEITLDVQRLAKLR